MNLKTTLQRVLAEFEQGNYFFVIEYLDREKKWHTQNLVINDHVSPEKAYEMAVQHAKEFGGRVSNFVENKAIKEFITKALTESLKEFSAAIEVGKKTWPLWGRDTAPAEGDTTRAKDKNEGFNAALQAIEERKQKYLNE